VTIVNYFPPFVNISLLEPGSQHTVKYGSGCSHITVFFSSLVEGRVRECCEIIAPTIRKLYRQRNSLSLFWIRWELEPSREQDRIVRWELEPSREQDRTVRWELEPSREQDRTARWELEPSREQDRIVRLRYSHLVLRRPFMVLLLLVLNATRQWRRHIKLIMCFWWVSDTKTDSPNDRRPWHHFSFDFDKAF
jgi:hypothetical protein